VDQKRKRKEAANCEGSFQARVRASVRLPPPFFPAKEGYGSATAMRLQSRANWTNGWLFLTCPRYWPALLMAAPLHFRLRTLEWNFVVENYAIRWKENIFSLGKCQLRNLRDKGRSFRAGKRYRTRILNETAGFGWRPIISINNERENVVLLPGASWSIKAKLHGRRLVLCFTAAAR
jgi:hypothetical protein